MHHGRAWPQQHDCSENSQAQRVDLTQLRHLLEYGFDSNLTRVHPKQMQGDGLFISDATLRLMTVTLTPPLLAAPPVAHSEGQTQLSGEVLVRCSSFVVLQLSGCY